MRAKFDPIASLREPITIERYFELQSEWQEHDRWDALRDGVHLMSDYTNVARGTRGYSLLWLEMDGYMRVERIKPARPDHPWSHRYTPTAAGLAKLAELERA
jgi:hypothetical protein